MYVCTSPWAVTVSLKKQFIYVGINWFAISFVSIVGRFSSLFYIWNMRIIWLYIHLIYLTISNHIMTSQKGLQGCSQSSCIHRWSCTFNFSILIVLFSSSSGHLLKRFLNRLFHCFPKIYGDSGRVLPLLYLKNLTNVKEQIRNSIYFPKYYNILLNFIK